MASSAGEILTIRAMSLTTSAPHGMARRLRSLLTRSIRQPVESGSVMKVGPRTPVVIYHE